MKFACTGGTLHGDAFGSAENHPVILLHGGGQTREAWRSTAIELSKLGFYAITIDLKGHGASYWDQRGTYSCFSVAKDLDEILIQTGLNERKPILIGASLGGLSAICAQTSSKFGGLVLVDIAPKMEVSGVNRTLDFMQRAKEEGYETLQDAVQRVKEYVGEHNKVTMESVSNVLKYDTKLERYFPSSDPRAFGRSTETLEKQEANNVALERMILEHAKRLTAPLFLVRGAVSDVVSDVGIANLQQVVPQMREFKVAKQGHMVAGFNNDVFGPEVLRLCVGLLNSKL